ncbi:MAG: DUF2330 domain-containing protein [Myxococcales bacterium]|nr:DUF2330 domain-containing protein [Myxococcales bacterium]
MNGWSRFRRSAAAFALAATVATSAATPEAEAFCGFYVSGSSEQLTNKATRVALMRSGQRTVLTMSNDYSGPPQDFAMVVPVPIVLQQENVRTLAHDVFSHIESLTAPRLVEYWEQDPCYTPPPMNALMSSAPGALRRSATGGSGSTSDLGVRIEARFAVGEYQILILSATQSSGLETWLRQNRYNIPQGAAAALAPYIREGMKFFVARVDIRRVQRTPDGGARLSPLRFHYDTQDFRLPVRLGLLNAPEKQDLIVYVLHPSSRFEVANYPNVFVPTNLDLEPTMRDQFGRFYTTLFDRTLERMNGRAVVTEYSWSTSSCDPCPTPPLTPQELATLGGDVIDPSQSQASAPVGLRGWSRGGPRWGSGGMTVTRLHTRYDARTLSEDLVFREAGAVVGGREHVVDAQTHALEMGAQPAQYGANNFQARYAIRHPWTGPIRCANPRRGVWGGPVGGGAQQPARPALDLASRTGGAVELPRVVRTAVPELGIRGAQSNARTQPTTRPNTPRTPRRVQPKPASKTATIALGSLGALAALGGLAALARRAVAQKKR